jgi:hypothetical protein
MEGYEDDPTENYNLILSPLGRSTAHVTGGSSEHTQGTIETNQERNPTSRTLTEDTTQEDKTRGIGASSKI